MKRWFASTSVLSLSLSLFPAVGYADTGPADTAQSGAIEEIIVTAQKRQERINDVPLSITALTGDQLRSHNVNETADLARVVPGFNVQTTLNGGPVYFVRGIGFSDPSPTSPPAVTVYSDEVPLPLSDMSRGASLDLARVEVLKGPQGTLFGGNSTGGAVNFIAAKPTDTIKAGASIGFGRFAAANIQGYLSGPLGEGISVRVAGEYRMQGDWQYSATRAGDTRGQKDFLNGRISMAMKPADNLNLLFTASGWRDRSDSPNLQLVKVTPSAPYPPDVAALNAAAYASTNARITDWIPGTEQRRDDSFYQFSLRGDLDLSEHIKLTSITAYSDLSMFVPSTVTGMNYPQYDWTIAGGKVFTQELRLAGDTSSLHWMVGANYQHADVPQTIWLKPYITPNAFGLYKSFRMVNNQKVADYAAFGSLELKLTDAVTARGSIRYSEEKRRHHGCFADFGDGSLAGAFAFLLGLPVAPPAGSCVTLDDITPTFLPIQTLSNDSLDENNVSWRLGLDWKAGPNTLLYATVAKGFKAGSYSALPFVFRSQMAPATQESVLAYEAGIKTDLFDRKLHLDLAGFYYDYTDKQFQGIVNIPPFANLPTLRNVPSSRVIGGEFSLTAHPTEGLRAQLSGTILDTKVLKDPLLPVDPFGLPTTYVGEAFPSTPKYQLNADVEQSFPVSSNAEAYVGAGLQYRSSALGVFGVQSSPLGRSLTELPSHLLVDLRAGVRLTDPNVRIEVWGNNVTNKYYYTAAFNNNDTFVRFAAMPTTWGVRISSDF